MAKSFSVVKSLLRPPVIRVLLRLRAILQLEIFLCLQSYNTNACQHYLGSGVCFRFRTFSSWFSIVYGFSLCYLSWSMCRQIKLFLKGRLACSGSEELKGHLVLNEVAFCQKVIVIIGRNLTLNHKVFAPGDFQGSFASGIERFEKFRSQS